MKQTWLIRAALMASAAALLATSAPDMPSQTFEFERSVAGEAVSLTADQASALFIITIRADALGPDGVVSTDHAEVRVSGSIAASEVEDDVPGVQVLAGSNHLDDVRQSFETTLPLVFQGTCDAPAENAPCQASFSVQLARNDDGAQGGSLDVTWSLDLTARGELSGEGEDQMGLDPPWTVTIEHP